MDPYGGYAPAPATIGPPVGRTGPLGQLLSGWWRRVGGYVIDGIVVAVPALIAWVVATAVITSSGGVILQEGPLDDLGAIFEAGDRPRIDDFQAIVGPGFWTVVVISLAVWLIASLINGVYLVSRSGQTIGDRVVSVRKVMADRSVPTVGTALARWLIPNVLFAGVGNLVPLGFLLVYANYLWPLWDSRSRTLHDMMVKTYVERADLAGPAVPRG